MIAIESAAVDWEIDLVAVLGPGLGHFGGPALTGAADCASAAFACIVEEVLAVKH